MQIKVVIAAALMSFGAGNAFAGNLPWWNEQSLSPMEFTIHNRADKYPPRSPNYAAQPLSSGVSARPAQEGSVAARNGGANFDRTEIYNNSR